MEPKQLSTNTWFYRPGASAAMRRANEERANKAVARYLAEIGFEVVSEQPRVQAHRMWDGKTVEVSYYWHETCTRVYRHLSVEVDGQRKDVRVLRKIAKEAGV